MVYTQVFQGKKTCICLMNSIKSYIYFDTVNRKQTKVQTVFRIALMIIKLSVFILQWTS